MTDNEIIKALESEVKSAEYVDSYYCDGVDLTLIKSAIDLINRQQAQLADERAKIEICAETISRQDAEIERLKGISVSSSKDPMDFCGVLCDYAEELIDKAKSEAIKEFTDRLLNKVRVVQVGNLTWIWLISQDDINDIIKEMLGEEQ